MAHFPMRWVVCLIFLLAQSCLFCSIAVVNLFVYCLCRIRADVSDLQCRESGWYPSSLCAPELRQPRSCSAQSVCCRRQTLLRGEALTQELPLRSLRLVCTAFNFSLVLSFPLFCCNLFPFLFSPFFFPVMYCPAVSCFRPVSCYLVFSFFCAICFLYPLYSWFLSASRQKDNLLQQPSGVQARVELWSHSSKQCQWHHACLHTNNTVHLSCTTVWNWSYSVWENVSLFFLNSFLMKSGVK